jgi:hypothetical protein
MDRLTCLMNLRHYFNNTKITSLMVKKIWIEVDKTENKGNINRQRQILGGKKRWKLGDSILSWPVPKKS